MPISRPGPCRLTTTAGPPPAHAGMTLHRPGEPGRAEVEALIAGIYRARFGARIVRFAPVLVALHDANGPVAAAGYRDAGSGPLFLERYLARPVQELLAPHAGAAPARRTIVEVGHLAAAQAGQGRRLVLLLGPHLAAQGYRWVVSTLTRELRHLLLRLGIAPLTLAAADPALLGSEAREWGSYYEHQPVVLAGHLRQSLRQLQRQAGLAGARP